MENAILIREGEGGGLKKVCPRIPLYSNSRPCRLG